MVRASPVSKSARPALCQKSRPQAFRLYSCGVDSSPLSAGVRPAVAFVESATVQKLFLVLMPAFNDPHDAWAASVLREAFPGRKVVPIDSRELIWGLGAFHCLTQQQPLV